MFHVFYFLFLLRGSGHLHDGGAEEILQRHEEVGLKETPEAHSTTSSTSENNFLLHVSKCDHLIIRELERILMYFNVFLLSFRTSSKDLSLT